MSTQHADVATPTTQPLRREPMQRRSVARVQRMLDAAQELVAEVGYDALTTTLIAERAGVSIGSLYQFFPDKQAVVRAVALRNLEMFSDRLTGMVRSRSLQTWWDVVSEVIDQYVDMHQKIPGFRAIRFGDVADLHLLDPERDNDTVVVDRFIELIAPFARVRATETVRLDLVIAVRIADSLTRYAFERDPAGDIDVLEETKRVVRAHLSRALGDPQVP
ncbi:MAG TPA: TetR/AcrR family transcriptional regulator [Sporichthyaceae bacterium]|nr:TetR/AcrR family transcriptional regulator [Sporichthyaceae bacterium]